MCTMWTINQVLSLKVLCYSRICILSGSCILGCSMCLPSCPLPLCIHGNSCPLDQLLAIEQCLNRLVTDHCEAHRSVSVLCIPMRVKGLVWILSNVFPELMSSLGGLLMWTLRWFLMASSSGL